MKRFFISTVLGLLMMMSLCAEPLVISLLGSGLDSLASKNKVVVNLDGAQVYLGGSTLGSLKKTLKTHDFLQLPFDQRSKLYENAQVPIAWPIFKNLLVGFGSGSQLQSDLGGRLFGQITDWTAASTIGVGMGLYLIDFLFIQAFSNLNNTSSSFDDPLKDLAVGAMTVGAIFLLAERIIQAILPIPYGLRYNKALRTGLGINKDGSDMFSFQVALNLPKMQEPNQSLAVKVAGKLSILR